MAFANVSLPAPASNGNGAAVDVSGLAAEKTVTVTAGDGDDPAFVIIEMSNQTSPTKWAPVVFFAGSGEQTVRVAARWMRATVTNYTSGSAPTVEVGAEGATAGFATLDAPAGDGEGAGADVSALPTFKTVHVAGRFGGTTIVEVSVDGGATYQTAFAFPPNDSGIQSKLIAADFMRVSRNGVPARNPGQPIVTIAAVDVGDGSGGSIASARLLGRIDPGAGSVQQLTGDEAATLLPVFTDVDDGLVPASGGDPTHVLHADGTWSAGGGTEVWTRSGTLLFPTETSDGVGCNGFRFNAIGRSSAQDPGLSGGGTFNNLSLGQSVIIVEPPIAGATVTGIALDVGDSLANVQLPFFFFFNAGQGALTFTDEGAGSSATNRFALVGAVPVSIPPRGGALVMAVIMPAPLSGRRYVIVAKSD